MGGAESYVLLATLVLAARGGSRDTNTLSLANFGLRETLEKETNPGGTFLPLLILPLQGYSQCPTYTEVFPPHKQN